MGSAGQSVAWGENVSITLKNNAGIYSCYLDNDAATAQCCCFTNSRYKANYSVPSNHG